MARIKYFRSFKIKLDLGDFYLISGDVWEATLLYSQVDKAMKDEPLGEEARLKMPNSLIIAATLNIRKECWMY